MNYYYKLLNYHYNNCYNKKNQSQLCSLFLIKMFLIITVRKMCSSSATKFISITRNIDLSFARDLFRISLLISTGFASEGKSTFQSNVSKQYVTLYNITSWLKQSSPSSITVTGNRNKFPSSTTIVNDRNRIPPHQQGLSGNEKHFRSLVICNRNILSIV